MTDSAAYSFRSISRDQSLSDKLADQLTQAIVSKKFRAGERLPSERALGEQFKVSRTVVREAVRSLAARGLVRVTSGRGVEVKEFRSSSMAASMRLVMLGDKSLDYDKVIEARTAVEVQIAGLAAERVRPEHEKKLRQICDDHERSFKKGDLDAASEFDFQFHRALTICADNELLLAMLDSIAEVLHEMRSPSKVDPHVCEEGLRAHRQILEAVVAENPKAAREAMAAHLAEAQRVWQSAQILVQKKLTRKRQRTKE